MIATDPWRPRVLVIDDEASLGFILERLLRPLEVTVVHECAAGRDALAASFWDAVLCDLSLPDGPGSRLFYAASQVQRPRFLFLTGGAFDYDEQRFLERCGQPVVYKPFDVDHLRGEVLRVLATGARRGREVDTSCRSTPSC